MSYRERCSYCGSFRDLGAERECPGCGATMTEGDEERRRFQVGGRGAVIRSLLNTGMATALAYTSTSSVFHTWAEGGVA